MQYIQKGSLAIPFVKEDYLNNSIDFYRYRGKKVLLSFLRGVSCPFCHLQLDTLIQYYEEFQANNVEVIIFYTSSSQNVKKYVGDREVPFPIIPDPQLKMYKEYGIQQASFGIFGAFFNFQTMKKVLLNKNFYQQMEKQQLPVIPADFLIDEEQIVKEVHYGKNYGDHLPMANVLSWIQNSSR